MYVHQVRLLSSLNAVGDKNGGGARSDVIAVFGAVSLPQEEISFLGLSVLICSNTVDSRHVRGPFQDWWWPLALTLSANGLVALGEQGSRGLRCNYMYVYVTNRKEAICLRDETRLRHAQLRTLV